MLAAFQSPARAVVAELPERGDSLASGQQFSFWPELVGDVNVRVLLEDLSHNKASTHPERQVLQVPGAAVLLLPMSSSK